MLLLLALLLVVMSGLLDVWHLIGRELRRQRRLSSRRTRCRRYPSGVAGAAAGRSARACLESMARTARRVGVRHRHRPTSRRRAGGGQTVHHPYTTDARPPAEVQTTGTGVRP